MLPRRLSRIIRDRERVRHSGRSNSYTFYRSRREIAEAPPVADAARRFRGSAPIGGHDSGRESAGTTVGRSQWPRSKLGASAVRQRGNFVRRNRDIRTPLHCIPCHADRGALSANSGRKCPKNAVKTHGFEILCAAGLSSAWKPSATRTGRAGLSSCFRIVSAPTAAGRSRGPALPWWSRDTLCVYRADKEPAAPLAMHP